MWLPRMQGVEGLVGLVFRPWQGGHSCEVKLLSIAWS